MKKLLFFLLLAGGATGLYFYTRKSGEEKLREETALLMVEESKRVGKPATIEQATLALKRFEHGNLEIFNRWVKAWIKRDFNTLQMMMQEMKTSIAPSIREAPDWDRFMGIVLPS
ncbi:MAG: hypothetical protein AAF998_18420 [Bacteroidota bacterium]